MCLSLPKCPPFNKETSLLWMRAPQRLHFHLITSVKAVFLDRSCSVLLGLGFQQIFLGDNSAPLLLLALPRLMFVSSASSFQGKTIIPSIPTVRLTHPQHPALPHNHCTLGPPLDGLYPCLPGVVLPPSPTRGSQAEILGLPC